MITVRLFQVRFSYDLMNLTPWTKHISMKFKVKFKFRDLKYRFTNNNRMQTLSSLSSLFCKEKELSGLAHNCVLSVCLPVM